jgi:mRNA interferase RelE/StbE
VLRKLEAGRKEARLRGASAIENLASDPWPSGAEKLTGIELYRIRTGEIRVVYSIEDDRLIVIVVRVGHRRNVSETSSSVPAFCPREASSSRCIGSLG